MRRILLFALLCGTVLSARLYAQPGCPSVNIAQGTNGVYTMPCGQTCANLTATAFGGAQSTSYTVSSIPYSPPFPFNTGTPIIVATDDIWSGVINLPFNFCYFGNTYNRIIVGSNGICSFNVANANAGNSWQIPGAIPSATPADLTNCIMGPWQDIDPTNQGNVYYEIGGTYPCRYFKVSWYNVPYYGDPNSVNTTHCQGVARRATQQIILYETSNAIEMYIQRKDVCSDWNSGLAIQGIQNANGTVAYTVPGRNGTVWTATNDAYRFTPAGSPNYTINWYDGNTLIGTGNTINVCPTTGTNYRADATYTLCANTQVTVSSYIYVNKSGVTSNVDSVRQLDCFNGTTGAAFASFNSNSAILSYGWSPGGTPNSSSITNIGPGTYTFTVSDNNNCTSSNTVTITNPAQLTVTVPDSNLTTCSSATTSLTATPNGGTAGYTYIWSPGNQVTQTITGLGAGTYTVTVTDSKNCTATDAGTVTISGGSLTFNQPVITDATCAGNDGSITVSVSGASGNVNYTWSPTQPNSSSITGLAGGTYSVTATDANGCSASASYNVGAANPISFGQPVITNATCAGNDGSIVVTVVGATGNVTYTWSPAQPDNDTITGLSAGTYNVTALDAGGCSATASYTVGQATALVLGQPVITNAGCSVDDGSIVVTVTSGTPGYSFNWSPTEPDNDTITGLGAGTYNVTVTDASGCTATASYTVTKNASFTIDSATINNASCGGSDGSIQVYTTGAQQPVNYNWSPAQANSANITGLTPGTYGLTITDGAGCINIASYQVGMDSVLNFNNPTITNASCNGADGSISVTVNGATIPVNYTWNPAQANSGTITGLASGSYAVTAVDANGCSAIGSFTVGQNNNLSFNAPTITNAGCNGAGGSITVSVNGASGNVNYNWSPSLPNSATVTGLNSGSYSVTATDANGCTVSATYNVGQNNALTITSAATNDVSCAAGSILVTVGGGNGTLTYSWSGGLTGNPATVTTAGTYTLTVSDQAGCSVTGTYLVGSSPCGDCPAVFTDNNVTIACGETCTQLSASAVAGYKTTSYTGAPIAYDPFPYTQGTSIIVNTDDVFSGAITLPFNFCFFGQTYNRVVVGSNGLVSFNTNLANQNSSYVVGPIPSTTPADQRNSIMGAFHDMDPTFAGQIRYVIDGIYPCRRFVVSWYDVPMFGDPNSVNDGLCNNVQYHQTQQIVLYETTNVIDIYIGQKQVCLGWNSGWAVEGIQNAAGTVAYTVPGRNSTVWTATNDGYRFTPSGAPAYQIVWRDGSTVIANADTVTVCPDSTKTYFVDALYINCANDTVTVSDSVIVNVLGNVTVSVDSVVAPSCHGGNNGAVYASYNVTNSTIVSYGWTPGGANQTSLTGIPAGTYIFSATNSTGCTVSDTVQLGEPDSLVVNVPDTTLYNCTATPVTTSLTASVTGGTAGYTFEWGGGQQTQTITGVGAGTYTITVTDSKGCTASDAGTVTQQLANPIFNQPVITNVSCNGGNDGSITVSVSQATQPVSYDWSGLTQDSSTVTGLTAGTYNVTALDANGCSVSATYNVTEPTPIVIGNPTITDATCTVGGTITVTATGGTGTLTYTWTGTTQTGGSIDSLSAGTYTLLVTDANGCTATASYTVNPAAGAVVLGNPTIVNVSCNGGNNGSITVTTSGGTGNINLVWSTVPVQNGTTVTGLAAGQYSVTATDAQGCTATGSYNVTQPAAITFGNPVITPATCTVGGTVTVTATGGTGTLTYGWSNGDTGTTADSIAGGTITVIVTDANQCTASASYTVPSNSITLGSTVVTNVSCNGGSNGSIHLVVTNYTAPLSYNWTPNVANDSTADGLAAGVYNVTVTDGAGCTASATYTITEPSAITLGNAVITDASCGQGGSITASATGGTGNLTYTWTGPGNPSGNPITGLAAGTYVLTVTDANGCSVTASYTVGGTGGGPIVFGNSIINNVTCNGANNGSITVIATGGGGAITYTWSTTPPQTGSTITGLGGGTYTVTADANGCSATASYTVTEPAALNVTIDATALLCLNSTDGTATANVTGGTPNYGFNWNPNNGSGPTITGLPVGIVQVTVTDANQCTASASAIIGQSPAISYNSQVNQPNCADLGFGTETLTPRGGTGSMTLTIPAFNNYDSTITMTGADTAFVISNVPTGNYDFTLCDAVGCCINGFFFVEAGAAEQTFDVVTDSTSCYGDNFADGSITLTPLTAGNAPYTYSLNGGATQTTPQFDSLGAGTYLIQVTNKYGCLDTVYATVEQPAQLTVNATPDTIITAANTANQINVVAGNYQSNPVYVWTPAAGLSCDSCDNPQATVTENTVYYVVVSESAVAGCYASDSVVVIVNGKLKMPNVFSPNGDGKNDLFGPVTSASTGLTVTEFRIYNRWGQAVHNSTEPWDGKFGGQDQPAGTYIYYITVKTPDENNAGQYKYVNDQGAVTLLR